MAAIYNIDTNTFSPHNIEKPTKSANSTVNSYKKQFYSYQLKLIKINQILIHLMDILF